MSFAGGFVPTQSFRLGLLNKDSAGKPSSTVELSITCKGLKDRDVLSKSDPMCVLYKQVSGSWVEVERTERIKNSLNPSWQKKFVLDYRFEEKQNLRFVVIDEDNQSVNIHHHDALGELYCSLGEIMALQSRGFSRKLGKGSGTMKIEARELSGEQSSITFSFAAKSLDNKDLMGKSDPFLQISRLTPGARDEDGTVVFRTETIDNNLNPAWKTFSIDSRVLCNSDPTLPLRLSVYDEDNDGSHDLIGALQSSLAQLMEVPGQEFPLINPKKKAKKGSKYKNSGVLVLKSCRNEPVHTFLDFIQGGLQVNFTVGIDFTASNGPAHKPSSLHYLSAEVQDNQYTLAIKSVGDIIQDYDYDKMFPCLGFGAKLTPEETAPVMHEFFVTLDPNNPFCAGVPGLLDAYRRCVSVVRLYGPTNFSPIIEHVAQFARAYKDEPSNYFVLLIITDGAITDMKETKRSIVNGSKLPMSIIIVGVGDSDFSSMEELDGDGGRLKFKSQVADRDVVQFVELRRFVEPNGTWSKERLTAAVLAEIPDQVLSYMRYNGFKPRPRQF